MIKQFATFAAATAFALASTAAGAQEKLKIGILTTLFTAFTLTRLIVAYWVRLYRPRVVPI